MGSNGRREVWLSVSVNGRVNVIVEGRRAATEEATRLRAANPGATVTIERSA